jgi:c-di-GMP phosphodiesterase Gmr
MKMWDNSNFAHGSQLSSHMGMAVINPVDAYQAQFAWLSSLPIASCIFRQDIDSIAKVACNALFDALVIFENREKCLDLSAFIDRIEAMINENRESHFECWRSEDTVTKRELEISIARFGEARDLFMVSLVDRTAEAVSKINLRREMLSDSLTGFFNRSGFEEEVELALEAIGHRHEIAGTKGRYAVVLIDLARFSLVNEAVGAMSGDELIITVARRINSRTRGNEILCRMSGNEFALFVDIGAGEQSIEPIANRLCDAFKEPCKLSDLEIQVECAVAAAIANVGDELNDTLRHAQIALKRAKNSKKFELYSPGSVEAVRRRFSIETDLRRALQRDELELHYQPLMDLDTGIVSGFEALARWNHPDLGPISPVDFIPVAEECGLIVPLGRWALAEAATTIAEWDVRGTHEKPFKISVNMSAVQMLRDDVTEAVRIAIDGAKIQGERLTIELTESAFVSDPDGARRILDSLKDLDVNLAMDDFGTGYSSLSYLQKLPIDVLKIDRSFVSGMMLDKDKRAIVRTVLSLARKLGMSTTAEGIETEELSNVLKRLGCSVGQGYFYAKPLVREAAYDFLNSSNAALTA